MRPEIDSGVTEQETEAEKDTESIFKDANVTWVNLLGPSTEAKY